MTDWYVFIIFWNFHPLILNLRIEKLVSKWWAWTRLVSRYKFLAFLRAPIPFTDLLVVQRWFWDVLIVAEQRPVVIWLWRKSHVRKIKTTTRSRFSLTTKAGAQGDLSKRLDTSWHLFELIRTITSLLKDLLRYY